MYKCKYIQPIQPQVIFGVELKEIYPPWYLHPSLKNLMYLAQVNIRNQNSTRFDLDEICGKSQSDGPVKQRLRLKELMSNGRNILNAKVAPGAPLWVLRHFLGLLPVPIFAPKSDAGHWLNFATECSEQLIECLKTRKNCHNLKFTIAFELAHLPDINLTFLFEFFDLLRFLSSKTLSNSKESVDNHAALVLAKYFVSSLFERPYTPGILRKIDKKYITIILYIIHFWPELRIQVHDLLISSIDRNEAKFHSFRDLVNNYATNNDFLRDIAVQTDLDIDCKESAMSLNFTELSDMQEITSADQEEQRIIEDLSKIEVIYDDCNMEIISPKTTGKVFSSTPCDKLYNSYASPKTTKSKRIHKKKRMKSDSSSSASSGKSKSVKVVSKKVRKSLRNTKNYEIIILELPYKVKRVKTRDIKITTLQRCAKEKKCSRPPGRKVLNRSSEIKILDQCKSSGIKIVDQYQQSQLKINDRTSEIKIPERKSTTKVTEIKMLDKKSAPKVEKPEELESVTDEYETKLKEDTLKNKYEIKIDKSQLLINTNTTDEYISDTFIGKNHEDEAKCFNFSKISKNPFTPKINTSPTYIDFNSPTRSIDLNPQLSDNELIDRITKFGWSYTKTARRNLNFNDSKSQLITKTATEKNVCKVCFDSEINDNTFDSSMPLTHNCHIGKCVLSGKTSANILSNLRRVGSRLNFFKLTAKVSVSCNDLPGSNIKYKKILKTSYSV